MCWKKIVNWFQVKEEPKKRKIKKAVKEEKGPQGIGGWLILPTLNFLIIAIASTFVSIVSAGVLLSGEFEINDIVFFSIYALLALLTIYVVILEFKKKKTFPNWAIAALWISVAATIFLSILDGDYAYVFGSIVGAVIWTSYFNTSKRVKNTFID